MWSLGKGGPRRRVEIVQSLGEEGSRWKQCLVVTPNLTSRWCLGLSPYLRCRGAIGTQSIALSQQFSLRSLGLFFHSVQLWYQGHRASPGISYCGLASCQGHLPAALPKGPPCSCLDSGMLQDPRPQLECPKHNSSLHALFIALTPRRLKLKMPRQGLWPSCPKCTEPNCPVT